MKSEAQEIESSLDRLRQRVKRRFLLHGLGWMLAAMASLLLFHLVVDRALVLPVLVRLTLLLALLVFWVQGFRRRILYPMRRDLGLDDMALLIERNASDSHQEIVSALQLARSLPSNESASMARIVLEQAKDRLSELEESRLLRPRRTFRLWAFAMTMVLGFGTAGVLDLPAFRVWSFRLLGADISYPRETFLEIQIPEGQANLEIVQDQNSGTGRGPILVRLARGAELPVLVEAKGKIPDIVEVTIRSLEGSGIERTLLMSRRGANRFRLVVRRTLGNFELSARGGDDPGTRLVRVTVLPPPTVTHLLTQIIPPAYTRQETFRREGGLVEALPGSLIEVHLHTSIPLEKGSLHFQDSDLRVELVPGPGLDPDPNPETGHGRPGQENPDLEPSDGERGPHYMARFLMPDKTDRYRIELKARNGLEELSKGVYSLVPLPDQRPRILTFSPGASLRNLTPNATIPLRLLASDDFGLTSVDLFARIGERTEPIQIPLFDSEAVSKDTTSRDSHRPLRKLHVLRFLSPSTIFPKGSEQPREGERITLEIVATDIREPDSQKSLTRQIALGLVDADELRRRLHSQLRSTRRQVESTKKVQLQQKEQLDAFLQGIGDGSGETSSGNRLSLAALDSGHRRIQAMLRRIRGNFAESLDAHIFNALDDSPPMVEVISLYQHYYTDHPELPTHDVSFYVEMNQARKKGDIGRMEVVGRLGDMFGISHGLFSQSADQALRALAMARSAEEGKALRAALEATGDAQRSLLTGLDRLLELLQEWNDFQDVIRATRQLREIQQRLLEETKGR